MAETTTTTFRFPVAFHELLDRIAAAVSTTRTEVIQSSVTLAAGLLNEASRASYRDLDTIRARHGDDARIVLGVFEEHGLPVAKLQINGKQVDDVVPYVWVDPVAGEAHLFMEVVRAQGSNPNFVKIGDEALFVAQPRMPVGQLPWPPKPHLAIQIMLADIEQAAQEAERTAKDLIEL